MRIIGGQWRSAKLERPASLRTRPVSDRVKESVFNILGCRYETPGRLPELTIADMFAGSGAFGLEALSRGAAKAWLIERNRATGAVLDRNIRHLGCADRAKVIRADVWRGPRVWGGSMRAVELMFLDPPFADVHGDRGLKRVGTLLVAIDSAPILADPALIMFRHDKELTLTDAGLVESTSDRWRLADQRIIGRSVLSILERQAATMQLNETDGPAPADEPA